MGLKNFKKNVSLLSTVFLLTSFSSWAGISKNEQSITSPQEVKDLISKLSGETQIGVAGLPGLISQRFSDSYEIFNSAEFLKKLYQENGIESVIEEYNPEDLFPYYKENIDETYREYFKSMIPVFYKEYVGFCNGTLSAEQFKKVSDRLQRIHITEKDLCSNPESERVEYYIQKTVAHSTGLTLEMLKKRSLQTWPNLYAMLPARNEDATKPLCIIGAHFDSVAREGSGRGPIVSPSVLAPGADDNASGTAGIFFIARELKRWLTQNDSKCDFVITHFSGEEEGLFGSLAFNFLHNKRRVLWMMNLDMIGYNQVEKPGTPLMNIGYDKLNSADLLKHFQLQDNFIDMVFVEKEAYIYSSDQISFWKAGVPALSISEQACSDAKCSDRFSFFNPYLHTTDDKTGVMNFSYATKIINQTYFSVLKAASL